MRKSVLLVLVVLLHFLNVEADGQDSMAACSSYHRGMAIVDDVHYPRIIQPVDTFVVNDETFVRYIYGGDRAGCKRLTLLFNPNVTTFVRDAEYFLPYTKGYSALGFFLKPTFTYNHDERLSVSAGLHLLGIAGDHKRLREVSPIVRIEYRPVKGIRIVGGTLSDECIGHGLYQPMYDYDRLFYANKEDGLQVFAYTKHWQSEMWCNWEDFIVVDSPWQEKFTFGWVNTIATSFKPDNYKDVRHWIGIPIHLMMNHRGGQIDAVQDTCIETLANVATGLIYSINTPKSGSFRVDLPVFGFSNRSDGQHIHTHFKKGWGIYPQLVYSKCWFSSRELSKGEIDYTVHEKRRYLDANIGYWYGDGFISGRGSYLFQSRSYFDDSFERRYRHMLTAEAAYDLNDVMLFRFQAYYDLDESSVDYAATFALRFDRSFKVHSWVKEKKE